MISFWWCTNVLFDTVIAHLDDLKCGICLMFNAGISWQLWLGDNNFYHLQLNILNFTPHIVQASSTWNHISYVSYLSVSCVIHLSLPYPDLGKVVHGCGRPIWSGWAGGAVEQLTAPLSLSAAHSRLLSCSGLYEEESEGLGDVELQPAAGCCWSLSRSPVGDSSQPVPACSPPQAQAPVWGPLLTSLDPELDSCKYGLRTWWHAASRARGPCEVMCSGQELAKWPTTPTVIDSNCHLAGHRAAERKIIVSWWWVERSCIMGTARAGAHTATILHHSSCLPVFSGPAGGTGRGGARAKCQVAIVQTKQNVISTLKCDDNERPRESAAIFSYQPSSPLPGPSRAGNGPSWSLKFHNANQPPYDLLCIGNPISCLLTVG